MRRPAQPSLPKGRQKLPTTDLPGAQPDCLGMAFGRKVVVVAMEGPLGQAESVGEFVQLRIGAVADEMGP